MQQFQREVGKLYVSMKRKLTFPEKKDVSKSICKLVFWTFCQLLKLFGETRTFDHIIEDTEELCGKLEQELGDLDKDEDCERVEEIEKALKFDDDGIEYFLNKGNRKPHSFKVVRSHRHRVRVREMLDSLNHNSDSEDEE